MINVVNQFGYSFKGLASYLLRGPNNDNPDRVDWTMTHNLGTDCPELGWRVMVDTARRAGELKKAAGFGGGGRKSKGPVMHYVLSWKPEEAETLTKEEMQRAALDSLRVLGKQRSKRRNRKTQTADEHQALVVAHKDKDHCHVHVMLSRVHPEHGLTLPSYKDYIRLSDWSHEYRKKMGLEHLTPERVKNYEARKRSRKRPVPSKRIKGTPRVPRHIYELQNTPVNDNAIHAANKAHHKQRDRRLTQLTRSIERKQTADRRALDQAYLDGVRAIRMQTQDAIAAANVCIMDQYDERWTRLAHEHDAEIKGYQMRERTWLGRRKNQMVSLSSIDLRSMVRGEKRGRALSDIFSVMTKEGAGLELLKRRLHEQSKELDRLERGEQDLARSNCLIDESCRLSGHRRAYLRSRTDLLGEQERQRDRLDRLWARQRKARVASFTMNRRHAQAQQPGMDPGLDEAQAKEAFNRSAQQPHENPTTAEDARQRQIEEARDRLKESREQRQRRPRRPRRKR